MRTRFLWTALALFAAFAALAPGAAALSPESSSTGGDVCVQSACSPDVLPVQCRYSLLLTVRCGFD